MRVQSSKSLDSSDVLPQDADNELFSDESYSSEREIHSVGKWVFLFTHRIKLDNVKDKLSKRFEVFVHKTVIYQHSEKGRIVKKEQPTIAGLIFIRGAARTVQKFLNDSYPSLHLVKNYATGRPAEIPDREMQAFMKIASVEKEGVRFMLNPLDYYSKGHQRIRITSGSLKGCEGYIVRLHRDRKLITQIGNMTVAIGGITKECFENAEEFVEVSRNIDSDPGLKTELTPAEQEIDRYFFTPTNDIEAMAISGNLATLTIKFQKELSGQCDSKTADDILFTLSEIADRFAPKYFNNQSVGINDVCKILIKTLKEIIDSPAVDVETKAKIRVELESMMLRHPKLPIDEIVKTIHE